MSDIIVTKKEIVMNECLNELKELAHKGYETAILQSNQECKEIFWEMILKSELELRKEPNDKYISPAKVRTYDKLSSVARDNMYLIAFCFSNYEHDVLYPKLSQEKALLAAASKLGVKKSTLKNSRDLFDGHNNSHRKGWYNSPMPEKVQKAKEYLESLGKKTVIEKAKKVLDL